MLSYTSTRRGSLIPVVSDLIVCGDKMNSAAKYCKVPIIELLLFSAEVFEEQKSLFSHFALDSYIGVE